MSQPSFAFLNRREAYRFQNSPFASTAVNFTHKHD
jgi:hypothetical protein